MLVLSRQRDEVIVIGAAGMTLAGPVEVMVTDIRGDKVRIGVSTTQREIPIHRKEVWRAIQLADSEAGE